jgi:hypothetical protein
MQMIKFLWHTICVKDHVLCQVGWKVLCVYHSIVKNGSTVKKISEPSPNSRHLNGDMKHVPY